MFNPAAPLLTASGLFFEKNSMPEKDPASYQMLTYLWVAALSFWGGSASYIRRVRAMDAPRYSVIEFIFEIIISGGVGLCTFFLCEWASVDQMLSAVFIAITAHMGSRALLIGEQIMQRWVKRKFDIVESDSNGQL